MNHLENNLIQYWILQGATNDQISHILGNQQTWK